MGLEKLSSNVWSHYLKIYVWLEGRALYRLLWFYVRNPKLDENVGIVIGSEAQKSLYPGYDLVTRGIYYALRMI